MSKDGKLVLICASDDDRVEVREAETLKLNIIYPLALTLSYLFCHLMTKFFT